MDKDEEVTRAGVAVETRRQIVDGVIQAVNRRDFEALEHVGFHPDMEFHSIVAAAEGTYYRGVPGLREWAAMADDTWSAFHIHVLDVVEAPGDRALVLLRLSGTARASGVPLDVKVAQVWQWRAGMLFRNVAYSDHDDAIRAAGLG